MDIFYYNKWTNLDLPEVRDCFEKMTGAETKGLEKGDAIWLDREPYHVQGKVYGYSEVILAGIEERGGKTFLLYGEKGPYGYSSCSRDKIFKIKDLEKLGGLLKTHQGKLTGLSIPEQDTSYQIFKKDWSSHGYPNIQ